jgi:hypothetical protein
MRRRLSSDLKDRLGEFTQNSYTVREVPRLGLRPGDLIEFEYGYSGGRRYGIVLKTDNHPNGIFFSTLDNSLYNVLTCESLDVGTFLKLLHIMYGNETRATYKIALGIAPLNPPAKRIPKRQPTYPRSVKDFRTLNISELRDNILKISIEQ